MKANKPAVIALVLWLLFVASNAFAVCKSPYPPKPYPPDQITVIGGGLGGVADDQAEQAVVTASQRK
jgi:hypothetical protein